MKVQTRFNIQSAHPLKLLVLAALVLASTACMTDRAMQRLDAKFEAGWRPSRSYCTWGGETPLLDAYCARVNFGAAGTESLLRNANAEILKESAGQLLPCAAHVARVKAELASYGDDYELTELYSCDRNAPIEQGQRVCHVSLLVADKVTHRRFVVDNGHVLSPVATGGVAPYQDFVGLVDYAWTAETPAWIALGPR
jgi:hypothetical protein